MSTIRDNYMRNNNTSSFTATSTTTGAAQQQQQNNFSSTRAKKWFGSLKRKMKKLFPVGRGSSNRDSLSTTEKSKRRSPQTHNGSDTESTSFRSSYMTDTTRGSSTCIPLQYANLETVAHLGFLLSTQPKHMNNMLIHSQQQQLQSRYRQLSPRTLRQYQLQLLEQEYLTRALNTQLPLEVLVRILSYVPVSLQRYELSPSLSQQPQHHSYGRGKHADLLELLVLQFLYGYFKRDRSRTIYCIFPCVSTMNNTGRLANIQPQQQRYSALTSMSTRHTTTGIQHFFEGMVTSIQYLNHEALIEPFKPSTRSSLLITPTTASSLSMSLSMNTKQYSSRLTSTANALNHLNSYNNGNYHHYQGHNSVSNAAIRSRNTKRRYSKLLKHVYLEDNNDIESVDNHHMCEWMFHQIECRVWSSLRTISISFAYVIHQDLLFLLLTQCPRLKKLRARLSLSMDQTAYLNQQLDNGSGANEITEHGHNPFGYLSNHDQLKSLNLLLHQASDYMMRALLDNRNLTSVKIRLYNGRGVSTMGDQSSNHMTSASFCTLPNLTHLTVLHLVDIPNIGSDEATCKYISQCANIRSLRFVNCGLNDATVQLILHSIPQLQVLDVSHNELLTSKSFQQVSKTNLIELVLNSISLNEDFIYALSSSGTIRRLTINGVGLTDSDVRLLFDFRLNLTHFTVFGTNNLTNNGLRFIKDGAENMYHLSISISDAITHRGIQFLVEHENLRSLSVFKNPKQESIPGVDQLLNSSNLEILNLNNINVQLEEINHLEISDQKNTQLKELHMPMCKLNDKITEVIFSHCMSLKVFGASMHRCENKADWSFNIGTTIARFSNSIEELIIHNETSRSLSGEGNRIIWQRVFFHLLPSLQFIRVE